MNVCVISGKLRHNAVLNGVDNKVLKFLIMSSSKSAGDGKPEVVSQVPCVLFNPNDRLTRFLCSEGKGRIIELAGRVARFVYDVDGQRRYSTEVVVDAGSFRVVN